MKSESLDFGGFGGFPGIGEISLDSDPPFRTHTDPRLAVNRIVEPSSSLPLNVAVRLGYFSIGGPKSFTASPCSTVANRSKAALSGSTR
jgi:hypothetical protein